MIGIFNSEVRNQCEPRVIYFSMTRFQLDYSIPPLSAIGVGIRVKPVLAIFTNITHSTDFRPAVDWFVNTGW